MSQNRYEVLGKIADGGLGSVYKAYDRNLRREVALKRVRGESPEQAEKLAEQLMDEARNLSALQHPHIVTIYDVGRDEEGAYIVMELLKGETLEDIIERGALSEPDFRELVAQSLEGMIAAHSAGMIHLDIKPQNFMVIWLPTGRFQIKILDFGLAKLASHPTVQDMDEEGAIMGSIFFMAPEQFERSPVDARTDLYSLGCVYYFALTQHYPFQGETGPEVMASHMYHSFIPLAQLRPDLPPFAHQWVEWLLNRLPEHRPADVAQAYSMFQTGEFSTEPAPDEVLFAQSDESFATGEAYVQPDVEEGTLTSPIPRPTAPRPGIHRPTTPTGPIGHRPAPKPIARPVNIASAMAPVHLQHKKPWPKWVVFGIPAAIAAVAILFIAIQAIGASRREARFDALAREEKPSGTAADVRMLLNLVDEKASSESAGQVLGKLQDVEGSNSLIVSRVATSKTDWGKKALAFALAQRGIREGVEPLVRQLDHARTPEPDTRIAIWAALSRLATASDLSALVERIKGAPPDELRAAENTLVNAARTEPDPASRGLDIVNVYRAKTGNDDEQATLLRALCRLGNRIALPDIKAALEGTNAKLRYSAALALGDWPTAEPVAALQKLLATEKDAITSLGRLAQLSGDTPQGEIAQSLITAYNAIKDSRTQTLILTALARVADPAALSFFQDLATRDPRRKPEATAAATAISFMLGKVVVLGDATTTLTADQATLTKGPLMVSEGAVMNWIGLGDQAGWLVKIDKPGAFGIEISQSSNAPLPGRYVLTFGTEAFSKSVQNSGDLKNFKGVAIGSATFTKPGLYFLWIRPLEIPPGAQLMRLKEATLTRTGG